MKKLSALMFKCIKHVKNSIATGYLVFIFDDFNIMPHDYYIHNSAHHELRQWAPITLPESTVYEASLKVPQVQMFTILRQYRATPAPSDHASILLLRARIRLHSTLIHLLDIDQQCHHCFEISSCI